MIPEGKSHALTMRKRLLLLTVALALCAVMAFGGIASAQETIPHLNVIHAYGSGSVIGTPDRVQISFSVRTENADVKTAQAENAARMNQVITALGAAGIPKDSLKTTGYTIYPKSQDSTSPLASKMQTYEVTNTLQVTLTDVSQSGTVIDVAVSSGINQVSSIEFMLSDAQSQLLRSQALKKAVANARADADTVAGALAVNITGTSDLVISRGYMPVVHNYATLAFGAREVAPTPVQPDDITVTAEVEITYG